VLFLLSLTVLSALHYVVAETILRNYHQLKNSLCPWQAYLYQSYCKQLEFPSRQYCYFIHSLGETETRKILP